MWKPPPARTFSSLGFSARRATASMKLISIEIVDRFWPNWKKKVHNFLRVQEKFVMKRGGTLEPSRRLYCRFQVLDAETPVPVAATFVIYCPQGYLRSRVHVFGGGGGNPIVITQKGTNQCLQVWRYL
jgi:hypothetical protein